MLEPRDVQEQQGGVISSLCRLGAAGWCHLLVMPAGGVPWCHRPVVPAGGVPWCHRLVMYGTYSRRDPSPRYVRYTYSRRDPSPRYVRVYTAGRTHRLVMSG